VVEQQQEQETRAARTPAESRARYFAAHIDFMNLLSFREQERFAEWDILREIGEEYEPLNESRLRIIDIQRRVAITPRLDRIILETMAKLREEVSNLRQKVDELTEIVRDTSRIYNATIHELGDSRFELTTPLQIVLEEDEEETVARIPELNLYASGDTDNEAINELKQEVIKLYEELESSDKKLGPLPKSWLLTLRKLIVKKNG
jgi:hypothetical protein